MDGWNERLIPSPSHSLSILHNMHSVLLLIFWRKLSVNWTAKGNQCLHWSSSYRENSNCVSLGLPACDDLVETGTTVENKWGKVSSVHPSIYRIEKPFASAKKKKIPTKMMTICILCREFQIMNIQYLDTLIFSSVWLSGLWVGLLEQLIP